MGNAPSFPPLEMKESAAFNIAVHEVLAKDARYSPQAYAFLCDALPHTVEMLGRDESDDRHVTGQELLQGCRDLALLEFGPMALFALNDWGVRCSADVGNMVYNFINIGYYGKNEGDSIEDFSDGVSLEEALSRPFRLAKSK